jgi:dethiobiotin synthetase
MKKLISPLWITGTGTDIGKSHLTAWLLKSWQNKDICAWKPLQSGVNAKGQTDSEWITAQSNHPVQNFSSFKNPLSPHICMEIEHDVDMHDLNLRLSQDVQKHPTIIEGAGGCMSPWTRDMVQADWIQPLKPISILVCPTELGAIHSSLTSLESLRNRNIPCLGFVYSRPQSLSTADNTKVIENLGLVPFLGQVPQFPWDQNSQDNGLAQRIWNLWSQTFGMGSHA